MKLARRLGRPKFLVLTAGVFVLAAVQQRASAQSLPKELLSAPVRLELSKPTMEVKAGSVVTNTVTLQNVRGQPVSAANNLRLDIDTPSGQKTVVLPSGQSSVTFTWQAVTSGVGHMTVRSGKLRSATGLVLVLPAGRIENVPGRNNFLIKRPTAKMKRNLAEAAPNRQPASQPAAPPPPPASNQARKIQLYIDPVPVYGDAFGHAWKAYVSVASLGDNDDLTPVSTDVPVHLNASIGTLSAQDITLTTGQFSNFQKPVVLTTNRSGKGTVEAISSLGHAGPIEIDYLQPPATQLHLSIDTPVLAGTGSSTADVQVCLLDESGAPTTTDGDIQITLSASGRLQSPSVTIHQGASCSNPIIWTSGPGAASIQADSVALKSDTKNITFPSFPWYFVWLAALGGLLGALISSPGDLFSNHWWSHTWRGLVLGGVLGAIFYLLARFGAIALPKDSPVSIQNIPVVSGIGAFLLGFLGGLYGRKLWKID